MYVSKIYLKTEIDRNIRLVFYHIDQTGFCNHHFYYDRRFTIPITSFVFILPFCFSKTIKFLQIPRQMNEFWSFVCLFSKNSIPFFFKVCWAFLRSSMSFSSFQSNISRWNQRMCRWKRGKTKRKEQHNSIRFDFFQSRFLDRHFLSHSNDLFLLSSLFIYFHEQFYHRSFKAHVNAVPVFVSLKSRLDCIKATVASTIVLILSYCFVAICGYLTFGTAVDHDILMSYKQIPTPVLIAIIMVAIKTYSAYPVNLFCGRTAIDSLSGRSTDLLIMINPQNSLKRRILIVSIWFATTLVAAVFLPNISVAIHYLGALAASFIFIFPGEIRYRLILHSFCWHWPFYCSSGLCLFFHVEQHWINSWSNIFSISIAILYVAIGVFVTALTLVQSLISDIGGNGMNNTQICS